MRFCYYLAFFLFPYFSYTQTAPDFTITTSDGDELELYADLLTQDKTVVLKLFFTFCTPCINISPATEALYQEWGAGGHDVEFISLSTLGSDDNNDVAEFKQDYNLTFPGAGSNGGASSAISPYRNGTFGQFLGTPTYVVIAPDGTVDFDPRGSGITGTINALDAAIAATGALKPGQQINYFSATGTIFGATGNPFGDASLSVTTETGSSSLSNNPFQITDIAENTAIEIEILPPTNQNERGISTFDLVQINQHILAIESFTEAYQLIAADANGDGTISTFDVIILRQLILSLIPSLPNDRNWLVFQGNPSNLMNNAETSTFSIDQITNNASNIEFTIVKVGDVTGDAY